MITVHAACPVCHQTIVYEHKEPTAYGRLSNWDYGIVEITGHDGGVLAAHKNTHTLSEWAEAQSREAAAHGAIAAKSAEYAQKR